MGDNIYFTAGCPAKMEDARLLTDWTPRDTLEKIFVSELKATNEHDYRKKLQAQGLDILNQRATHYMNESICKVAIPPSPSNP